MQAAVESNQLRVFLQLIDTAENVVVTIDEDCMDDGVVIVMNVLIFNHRVSFDVTLRQRHRGHG